MQHVEHEGGAAFGHAQQGQEAKGHEGNDEGDGQVLEQADAEADLRGEEIGAADGEAGPAAAGQPAAEGVGREAAQGKKQERDRLHRDDRAGGDEQGGAVDRDGEREAEQGGGGRARQVVGEPREVAAAQEAQDGLDLRGVAEELAAGAGLAEPAPAERGDVGRNEQGEEREGAAHGRNSDGLGASRPGGQTGIFITSRFGAGASRSPARRLADPRPPCGR